MSKIDKTTYNVKMKKLRKKELKQQRKEEDEREARRLGITVAELKTRRHREAQKFRRNPRSAPTDSGRYLYRL